MKKIDLSAIEVRGGSNYPSPFDEPCKGQTYQRVARDLGITEFGVNLSRLPPGVWSSQRHWHTHEDEFVWMLEGEVTLVEDPLAEDGGAKVLKAGDCMGWKAGAQNGHCLQNRSDRDAVYLEVGSRRPDTDACDYPDIDMVAKAGEPFYRHRDGTAYPPVE